VTFDKINEKKMKRDINNDLAVVASHMLEEVVHDITGVQIHLAPNNILLIQKICHCTCERSPVPCTHKAH